MAADERRCTQIWLTIRLYLRESAANLLPREMSMIDLFSDTMTRPSAAMRRAMADAEVGDEQRREDPTTNRLQEMVASLLGKEAAVFLPSGTMCNEVAIKTH